MQDRQVFINMIKPECIKDGNNNKILPSIIAALAIVESDYGNGYLSMSAMNIFSLTVGDNWFKKCYSKNTKKTYDSVKECHELGSILYRVYSSYNESILDFVNYLSNTRRSKNGPYKYESIKGCLDFKESINRLIRSGFMKDYLNKYEDPDYAQKLITTIENYKLYKWDEDLKNTLREV